MPPSGMLANSRPMKLEVWKSFIQAKYLNEASTCSKVRRCKTCKSSKYCYNRYCLQCMVGGLCHKKFEADQEHDGHPCLQVRMYSRMYAVRKPDLEQFIDSKSTERIDKRSLRKIDGCLLRKPKDTSSCCNCQGRVSSRPDNWLVCSLECLISVARLLPKLNLFNLEDGAAEHTEPPLLAATERDENKCASLDLDAITNSLGQLRQFEDIPDECVYYEGEEMFVQCVLSEFGRTKEEEENQEIVSEQSLNIPEEIAAVNEDEEMHEQVESNPEEIAAVNEDEETHEQVENIPEFPELVTTEEMLEQFDLNIIPDGFWCKLEH